MNTIAYRTIALDFELWSHARSEIQDIFFEHFETLVKTSKHRAFNAKQRFSKFGVIRKLLFVLHTTWFTVEMVSKVIKVLRLIASVCFSAEDAIKPIVSYLAARLHDGMCAWFLW